MIIDPYNNTSNAYVGALSSNQSLEIYSGNLESGTYTIHFWYKCSGNFEIGICGTQYSLTSDSSWHEFNKTITVESGINYIDIGCISGGTINIWHIKFEKGTKPTDFSHNEDDYYRLIESTNSEIVQTAEQILTKVSKNDIISAINQSAESITIEARRLNLIGAVTISSFDDRLKNSFNGKVDGSDIYTANTTTIDGGKITTNSINADKINVSTLTTIGNTSAKHMLLVSDGVTLKDGSVELMKLSQDSLSLYKNSGKISVETSTLVGGDWSTEGHKINQLKIQSKNDGLILTTDPSSNYLSKISMYGYDESTGSEGSSFLSILTGDSANRASIELRSPLSYGATIEMTAETISLYGLEYEVQNPDEFRSAIEASSDKHTHNYVMDIGNSSAQTTFAYSKSGLGYADYSWLAGWNGYELRAVSKSQFAQASHSHNYLPTANIAKGHVSATSCSASTYTDISVSFGKTFSANPQVVVSFRSDSTSANFGKMALSVHSITTTGCKIRVFNSHTSAFSPAFSWIAIA